ncbi:MAG: folate family ECF transporter S component, partial [Clostridia bacterium]|nr:folate family ECF transporter S component [Clostridia bacterium]
MKKASSRQKLQSNVRLLAVSAFLAALSIICGKYLALSLGNVLRFSFENLSILLAGMVFGPVVGAVVGIVADLVGCLMVGYAINPLVTLGAACVGLLGGLL